MQTNFVQWNAINCCSVNMASFISIKNFISASCDVSVCSYWDLFSASSDILLVLSVIVEWKSLWHMLIICLYELRFYLFKKLLLTIILLLLFSATKLCPTLCDSMNSSTPGFPTLHYISELAQTHIHWVGDVMQPSHSLSSPFPPFLNLLQPQGLFQWVSSSNQLAKVVELQLHHQSFQWINIWSWFLLGLTDLISLLSKGLSRVFSSTTVWKHLFLGAEPSWWSNSHIGTWPLRVAVWASMRSLGVAVLLVLLVSRTQVLKGTQAGGAGRRMGWIPWPWPSHKLRQGCRRGLPFQRHIISLETLCYTFVKASLFSRCHLTNEVQECDRGPSQFTLLSYH